MNTELLPIIDLGIAWTWEYDDGFVRHIEKAAAAKALSILNVTPGNVDEITDAYCRNKLIIRNFLDRASDEDDRFHRLSREIVARYRSGTVTTTRPLNPIDEIHRASDKATMHLEFLSHGIHVPYTIIISPFNHQEEIELTLSELAMLGRPFIIKPANTTGGGIGVVMGAETLKEVIEARQFHKNDKYLLQETIIPVDLGGKRAWFRVFYAFGETILCWWNDRTHIYEPVTDEEEQAFQLGRLRGITQIIHTICRLDFFSTEIAFTANSRVVAVDYVNDTCDMRCQSKYADGVPDEIIKKIIEKFVSVL